MTQIQTQKTNYSVESVKSHCLFFNFFLSAYDEMMFYPSSHICASIHGLRLTETGHVFIFF